MGVTSSPRLAPSADPSTTQAANAALADRSDKLGRAPQHKTAVEKDVVAPRRAPASMTEGRLPAGSHQLAAALRLKSTGASASESGATRPPTFWQQSFDGSPVAGVGKSGMFPVHEASAAQVGLLSTGQASLAARLQALKAAKHSIRIQALIFTADEAGRAIAEVLKQKKKEGLDVRVIVDPFSNMMTPSGAPDLATQLMYYDLKAHGIEVEGYEALGLQWMNEVSATDPRQLDKRFHDKMWVVDAEDEAHATAIVGGMNIANEYFRTGSDVKHRWRDQDFLLKGTVVADVAATFDRNYADQKEIKASRPGLLNTDKTWSLWRKQFVARFGSLEPSVTVDAVAAKNVERVVQAAATTQVETAPAKIRFFQSRPREKYQETYIYQAYEHLFASAQRELLVVNAYFIPDAKLIADLKSAARRGAVVTIVTNSAASNDLPQMAYASRYLYKELLAVNAEPGVKGELRIAEWNPDKADLGTLHAKFAVADRRYLIGGSYNLDRRSQLLNSETAIAIESEALAGEAAAEVTDVDLANCDFITAKQAEAFHDPKNPPDWLQLLISNGLKNEF